MRRLARAAVVVWSLLGVAPSAAEVSCPAGTHVERFGDAKKGEEWCVKDAGGGRHGQLFLRLPRAARQAVREEVRRQMAPFRVHGELEMQADVLFGSGQR